MAIWADAYGHRIDWRGPTSHCNPGQLGGGSRGLVCHIASGFYEGTISWQLGGSPPTSSTWIVGRAGQIAQMLDTDDASWAQGPGNDSWHSVEFEGFGVEDDLHAQYPGWEALTDEQVEAAAALLARGHLELGWALALAGSPDGLGLGHHSMGAPAWGHALCPGQPIIGQKQAILDGAIALLAGGSPETGDDEEMSTGMVPAGFAFGNGARQDGLIAGIGLGPVGGGDFHNRRVVLGLGADFTPKSGVALRVAIKSNGLAWGVQTVTLYAGADRYAIFLPNGVTKISVGRAKRASGDVDTDASGAIITSAETCPVWWDLEFEKR
jgi:hypothetical protein